MKTKLLYFAIPFLFIMMIIASCKKETPNSESQIPSNDLKLANLIKGFKDRGESHLKSGTLMSIDTALWYIGATANFTYGDASRQTERSFTDTCFITIPISNGKISESMVYAKYEAVIDNLRSFYQAKNEENKQLLAVTVTTQSVTSSQLVCKVTGIFAYGLPTNIPTSFNNIDSWFFWWLIQGGICNGPNSGTQLQSDAAEETQKRIMNARSCPCGNYWYDALPIVPIYNAIPIDPNTPPNNHRYSYLYWNSSEYPDFNGCIPPADLNFYLAKTKELIYNDTDHNGKRPVGSSFIGIDMWGDSYIDSQYPYPTIYLHKANVYYGILHWNPNIPDKLD